MNIFISNFSSAIWNDPLKMWKLVIYQSNICANRICLFANIHQMGVGDTSHTGLRSGQHIHVLDTFWWISFMYCLHGTIHVWANLPSKYHIYSKYCRISIKRLSQINGRVNSLLFLIYCTLFMFHFLKAPLKWTPGEIGSWSNSQCTLFRVNRVTGVN